MNNFSITSILKESYFYMFTNIGKFLKNIWLVALFLFVAYYLTALQGYSYHGVVGGWLYHIVFWVTYFISIIIEVMMFVYILNIKFKNDSTVPGISGVFWDRIFTTVFTALIIEYVFVLLPVYISLYLFDLDRVPFSFTGFLGFILWLVSIYISCRVCIFVPVCYLESNVSKASLLKALSLTKGKAFKIFVISLGLYLPLTLLFYAPIFLLYHFNMVAMANQLKPIMFALGMLLITYLLYTVKIVIYKQITKLKIVKNGGRHEEN